MNPKVLVIDDNVEMLALLKLGLERGGFQVITAERGETALRLAYQAHPDAIVLDIMMPAMDGWMVCQRLRQVSDVPILMLTGRSSKADIIKGLSVGADDYLVKPCSLDELNLRLHTLLRRSMRSHPNPQAVYDDGHLHIDLHDATVVRDGEQVQLTPTESRLLTDLVRQRGKIVPRERLLHNVWGPGYGSGQNCLSVYIRYLRQKLEDDPHRPRYIRTCRKVGYYFAANGTA
jgi:DNA-binding response OmpR family regulator